MSTHRSSRGDEAGSPEASAGLLTSAATPNSLPPAFWKFLGAACKLQTAHLHPVAGDQMPEPARTLLVHERDMTSTLAQFHRSALRVDVIQQRETDRLYLREVFLRTIDSGDVVEYGVIAVALEQFTAAQVATLFAGQIPLGGLLHHFKISFVSSPLGFFSVPAASLPAHCAPMFGETACHGRFNLLARPTGEPLAWIMEILPPAATGIS